MSYSITAIKSVSACMAVFRLKSVLVCQSFVSVSVCRPVFFLNDMQPTDNAATLIFQKRISMLKAQPIKSPSGQLSWQALGALVLGAPYCHKIRAACSHLCIMYVMGCVHTCAWWNKETGLVHRRGGGGEGEGGFVFGF